MMEVLAWKLAHTSVTDQITLLITMPDYRQRCVELSLRSPLSLADAIVLVQHLGRSKASAFIDKVDPWVYPTEKTRALVGISSYVQKAVDKAAHAGKEFKRWTPESLTAYLLSPLLILKGKRPDLIRISRVAPRSSAVSDPDGGLGDGLKEGLGEGLGAEEVGDFGRGLKRPRGRPSGAARKASAAASQSGGGSLEGDFGGRLVGGDDRSGAVESASAGILRLAPPPSLYNPYSHCDHRFARGGLRRLGHPGAPHSALPQSPRGGRRGHRRRARWRRARRRWARGWRARGWRARGRARGRVRGWWAAGRALGTPVAPPPSHPARGTAAHSRAVLAGPGLLFGLRRSRPRGHDPRSPPRACGGDAGGFRRRVRGRRCRVSLPPSLPPPRQVMPCR